MGKGRHISDDAFSWKARSFFIPWTEFMSMGNLALTGDGQNIWITGVSGTTAGTPLVGEIGATSTDIAGIEIGADGDLASTYWPFPSDMDMDAPQVMFRVHFVHEGAAADVPVWKVVHLDVAAQEGFLEPVANATETVTFAAHTCGTTADSLEITAWKAAATQPGSADNGMLLAVELDNHGSATAGEIFILGLECGYKAAFLDGQGPAD